ncbi:hypothetical protein [Micromonospora arida]
MTLAKLLDEARAVGLRIHTDDGTKLTIRGPQEAGDLARLLLSRKAEVLAALAEVTCCGQRSTGTAGAPLVNACQLCPTSPTYWRDQEPSPAPTAVPVTAAAPVDRPQGFVWSHHATGDPLPCRLCRKPAIMRDAEGRPCHKTCAEQAAHTAEVTP